MSVKIRLSRAGAKKRPFYHIVIADVNAPRDGKFIERVGTYNPMLPADHADRVTLKTERLQYWLGNGAQATDRVARFLAKVDLVKTTDAGLPRAAEAVRAEEEGPGARRRQGQGRSRRLIQQGRNGRPADPDGCNWQATWRARASARALLWGGA